jgi:D-alanyl-D-alanine carboxypeptidase/D-alanyl-D-alanine-endopeptidase (penicillin-binding protein 4)
MRNTSWFKKRSFQIIPGLVGLTLVLFTFQAATPFTPRNAGDQGGLDPRIVKIMNSSPYRHGEWGLLEVDPATGRIVHSLDPVQRFFNPGSTAKIFSVSGALYILGFNHRFTTPVFAVGQKNGGSLTGNLILVAQGDLTMGGRTKPDGTVDFTNLDHGDANSIPGATLTPEDPLAGLNLLAKQVRAYGITHVAGDMVIDDRLFQPDPILNPSPDPIIINDNLNG